jgi:pimeloyl-ACP methyl ester carboxylesterase
LVDRGPQDNLIATEIEESVLAAAQDVGIAVQNQHDNIFQKGADSIAGLRLIFKLEAGHNIKIDVSRVFADGRISSIAAALKEKNSALPGSNDASLSLMLLAASDSQMLQCSYTPMFLCHGAGTTALALKSIASELTRAGAYKKVYGLSDSFLTSKSTRFGYSSIQEVASEMADLITSSIANLHESEEIVAEVALGGWSYGGVVAFACAHELQLRGICTRHVVMLDAPIGQQEGALLDDKTRKLLGASVDEELADRIAEHFKHCNDLLSQYRPPKDKCLAAPIFDVRPVPSQVDYLSNRDRKGLASSWERVDIQDATHFTLVQSPFIEKVSDAIVARMMI